MLNCPPITSPSHIQNTKYNKYIYGWILATVLTHKSVLKQ